MIKKFFTFRFMALVGVFLGLYLCAMQSETRPMYAFLTAPYIYIVGFLIVFVAHFLSWIVMDKATFYNVGATFSAVIFDYIVLNVAMLSTIGTVFLIETFLL